MQVESDRHFAEELLEKYAMGHMAEDQMAPLEEHLLICSDCQVRVAHMDDYVRAAKAAARDLERKKTAPKQSLWDSLAGRFWQVPKPLWAAGLAAALAVAVLVPMRHQDVRETEVYLSTSRGLQTRSTGGSKILLHIDTSTLALLPAYQLQVVSSSGSEVWSSRVIPENNLITARVSRNLSSGRYWVRLYNETDPAQPLQEFELNVD